MAWVCVAADGSSRILKYTGLYTAYTPNVEKLIGRCFTTESKNNAKERWLM